MLKATHPWWVEPSEDQKKGRFNCISYLLCQVPYEDVPNAPIRVHSDGYKREPTPPDMVAPERY